MIDFHTHTTFSDGELIPAELIRRAKVVGYKGIGISDHADLSNLEFIIKSLLPLKEQYSCHMDIEVFIGVELTHVPPSLLGESVFLARKFGAEYVVVHGETIVEPVARGTNLAAIEAGVDILAHPGLITEEEVKLAKENKVYLEITTRKGHSLTNGHVAKLALKYGAKLLINNDAHAPSDLVSKEMREKIGVGCGLSKKDLDFIERNAEELMQKMLKKKI
ncbi:Histidinol phosphatase [Desulfonauticus submarinus]|uniref:Histidinol phosphatase n=1 Tax=Desulfonauticus submarinus TaxID=206665 RepID=A0A1G9ZJ76_9BACT|nr:histidinol phosphate phosphatase domain-containing protein [Desulfonauticus submarinus]SDN21081.1 Histidinol phosphatase [Desulfonauticus submarinus]